MTIGPPQPSIEFSPHTSYQSFTCPSKHIFPLFSNFRFPSKRRCPSARNGLRIHDMTSETRTPSQEAKLLDVSWNVEEVTTYLKRLKSEAEAFEISQTAKSTPDLPSFSEQAGGNHAFRSSLL
ncbi:unnamed protein product [Somion occarium]|uniref:Uncharacterized protein n=1 Tax=Somion occarium TaxID=3059160 RepID=A0ABP1CQY3_9APHY